MRPRKPSLQWDVDAKRGYKTQLLWGDSSRLGRTPGFVGLEDEIVSTGTHL